MRRANRDSLIPTPGVADQALVVTTAIIAFAAFNEESTHVLLTVSAQPVRVTFDGSDPTTDNGHVWAAGYEEVYTKEAAAAMQFYRDGGTDAYIHASEFAF